VLGAIKPFFADLASLAEGADVPFDAVLAGLFATFQREILATRRREIPRLVLAEGRRFPTIAAFYHREVISPGLALMRRLAERAHARGELASDALVRHPLLLFGPLLASMLWETTFEPFEHLDVDGLLRAHRELLAGAPVPRTPPP
jgi:hypothetical protein